MKKLFSTLLLFLLITVLSFAESISENVISNNVSGDNRSALKAITNSDYMVTAGDVYSLYFLAGNSPVSLTLTLDSSYKLRVANLAVLDVSNTSFITLKKQVESIVSRNYPMSGVQFTLITPGSFNVVVKGEVNKAKEISAWALTRLSDIVYAEKNNYASIRNVKVTSKYGKEKTYDLFEVSKSGDFSQDPYLRPGDTITLYPIEKKVTISGAVKRPGSYELKAKEGLKELINYYGDGLVHMADTSRIELYRTYETELKSGEKYILTQDDIEANFELKPYDSVNILTFNDLKPVVFFQGAVNGGDGDPSSPDHTTTVTLNFNSGETYNYFLRKNRHFFGANADLEKSYIIRDKDLIPINLYNILYNNENNNLEIKPNDILVVPAKQLLVSVLGSVKVPGRYPFLPDKKWDYYINLAGGFIEEKNSSEGVKIVDINGNELSKEDAITPETTITAKTNDFLYYFNTYAPVVTTLLTAITTGLSLFFTFSNMKQ